jgi:hypothetical protein
METEQRHRATSADLQRAFQAVMQLEQANAAIEAPAIEAFLQEGRLGHPGAR